MAAVDLEIAVGGEEQGAIVNLRQPDECCIRQGSWNVFIATEQGTHGRDLLLQGEGELHHAPLDQLQRQRRIKAGACEQEAGFGHHGFTTQQWRLQLAELLNGPAVVGVAATEQGDPGAGVEQHRHDQCSPKPAR